MPHSMLVRMMHAYQALSTIHSALSINSSGLSWPVSHSYVAPKWQLQDTYMAPAWQLQDSYIAPTWQLQDSYIAPPWQRKGVHLTV